MYEELRGRKIQLSDTSEVFEELNCLLKMWTQKERYSAPTMRQTIFPLEEHSIRTMRDCWPQIEQAEKRNVYKPEYYRGL